MKKPPRRRRRRGWMSAMRSPPRGKKPSALFQWFVVTPVLVLLFAGIAAFIYVSYFNPSMVRGEHVVRTEIRDRVEKTLPDGTPDLPRSYLLVSIEGRELRLKPIAQSWDQLAKGDTLEIEVGRSSADGSPVAYSYRKVEPARAPQYAPVRQ